MKGTRSSQTEVSPKVLPVESVKSVIEKYFERISVVQWGYLLYNNPDNDTKRIMNDLLSEVVLLISGYLREESKKRMISQGEVFAIIRNTVPTSFAEVLSIRDNVHSDTSESLTTLIAEEVIDILKSGSTSVSEKISLIGSNASQMLTELFTEPHKKEELKNLNPPSENKSPDIWPIYKREEALRKHVQWGRSPQEINDEGPDKEGEDDENKESVYHSYEEQSEESCKALIKKLAEDLIFRMFKKAKMKCSKQKYDDFSKQFYQAIWAEAEEFYFVLMKRKFEKLDKAIYNDICKSTALAHAVSLACGDVHLPLLERVAAQSFRRRLSYKANIFQKFARYLLKKCQRNKQYSLKTIIEDEPALQDKTSESNSVEDLMNNDTVPEVSPFGELVSQDQVPDFTTCEIRETLTTSSEDISWYDADILESKKESCRLLLDILLTKLFSHLYTEANINCSEEVYDDVMGRLYRKLWEEMKKVDFNIPLQNFENLHEIIYKELCKADSNRKVMAVMFLDLERRFPDTIILNTFKKQIFKKKTSTMKRFFSALGLKKLFHSSSKCSCI